MQLKHASQTDGKIQGTAYNLISAAVREIHAGLSSREEAHYSSTQPCTTALDDSKLSFPVSKFETLVRNQNSRTRATAQVKWEKPGSTLLPLPAEDQGVPPPTANCASAPEFSDTNVSALTPVMKVT